MRHCTACGRPTRADPGPHFTCPACQHVDHVNPAPCVGVAILKDDAVLLARRARDPRKGQWDLVGGFVDIEETVPEAAHREVQEETGLRIAGLRRLHQAPGWYTPEQPILAFVYAARFVEGQGEPDARDDVAEVRWFPLDALPPLAWEHEAEALGRLHRRPKTT